MEKLEDSGSATKGRRQLIKDLLWDFSYIKELLGYEDYRRVPTSGELICAMRRFMRELIVEIHANFCDSPVIEDEDEVAECYELWNGMRRKLGSYYKGCVSHSVISIYITRGLLKGGKECAIF